MPAEVVTKATVVDATIRHDTLSGSVGQASLCFDIQEQAEAAHKNATKTRCA